MPPLARSCFSDGRLTSLTRPIFSAPEIKTPLMSNWVFPSPWIAETGGDLPGDGDPTFALSMAFTPENALNLRALVTAP